MAEETFLTSRRLDNPLECNIPNEDLSKGHCARSKAPLFTGRCGLFARVRLLLRETLVSSPQGGDPLPEGEPGEALMRGRSTLAPAARGSSNSKASGLRRRWSSTSSAAWRKGWEKVTVQRIEDKTGEQMRKVLFHPFGCKQTGKR